MIYLLAHDLEQKLKEHELRIENFPNFLVWQAYFEERMSLGYMQAVMTPKPTKFAIAGYLIHSICQDTDLSEGDLLDIAQLPSDYLAKVRLGQIRMSHFHLSAFAEGVFSYVEDRAEYQTACLVFFMSYRQSMLLDIERGMLNEYGHPIDELMRETTGFLRSQRGYPKGKRYKRKKPETHEKNSHTEAGDGTSTTAN